MRNAGFDLLAVHDVGAVCRHEESLAEVFMSMRIDIVGDDHTVVDRAQPTGHDDADAAGVIQALDLFGQARG